jgi:Polyketide cyclase / dehydrase and lipid transport
MRRPWFKNEPVDETFFDSAPVRLSDTFAISQPASDVWNEITADGTLWWCRILDDVSWTSPRPFGVGTTRTVKSLKGANVINEYFFRWEEGRRKSFYVVDSSAPLFKRFAEDYNVEPTSDDSCRFTWTIAYESRPAMKAGRPVNDRILRTLHTDTRKHFGSP